jgi:hypothetical protein
MFEVRFRCQQMTESDRVRKISDKESEFIKTFLSGGAFGATFTKKVADKILLLSQKNKNWSN